ncbi:MAG: serine/threonine-protein kinase [Paludisphaera borealis]|uniref:serine/threonine-protein kinase n=1 Tax=Paludisphaera borealis TaxID=1387353 RepID=UPI00284FB42E|nr:serine/threonine-protein kinase [Paludisphaera borealis]MDR3618106.1 serine/threonine-protein kinase [Paludisphaera borealis]
MATFERSKSSDKPLTDLLPVLRGSKILSDRQVDEIRNRMLRGEYPSDPTALAERLIRDQLVTHYQARRLLGNKPYGLVVGRYIILDRIGSGSMGRVYKAHHQMMDRVVALKVIAPEIAANERVVARFQREMKLVGRLDHPNVVRAYDADQVNRILFLVMEYVPGESLGERLKRGPIPAPEMIDYAAQAAHGLAHAHGQGMVHRDVKPSNMLLTEDRKIKILDLGLGVLMQADDAATFATADGVAVGTVDYMSPEQALGRDVDGRSDIFSLGCAMFHLITGKLAYPGETPIDRLGRRINKSPVPITDHIPDFPSSAVRVIEKMMAYKPQDRYDSALEAADALQALIRPKTRKPAPPPAPSPPPSPPADEPDSAMSVAVEQAKANPLPLVTAPETIPPRWLAPVARRPAVALASAVAALALAFAAGVGVGYLLK